VRYEHSVKGVQQSFDSSVSDARTVPAELALYAGLVNNGFSFWLGRDNTVGELVGYNAFLQRCVALLPVQQQAAVLSGISDRFGTEGVAGFVDDSIGILPYNAATQSTQVSLGDIWTREKSVAMPVPVQVKSTYRLQSVAPRAATIQVTETLTPTASVPGSAVAIDGGRSMGTCIIDRTTGLPVDVGRTTFVSLRVNTADGQSVAPENRIVTRARPSSVATTNGAAPPVTAGPQTQPAAVRGSGDRPPGWPSGARSLLVTPARWPWRARAAMMRFWGAWGAWTTANHRPWWPRPRRLAWMSCSKSMIETNCRARCSSQGT